MKKIIECVPNFSEGRDPEVIEALSSAISSVAGCTLIDVDPGRSTNRTVYTFVGDPESIVEGALAAARVAKSKSICESIKVNIPGSALWMSVPLFR